MKQTWCTAPMAVHARVVVAAVLLLLVGCKDHPVALTFAAPSIVVDTEGGTVLPAVAAQGEKGPVPLEGVVTYLVNPPTVAEVVNGVVKGIRNGKATISAIVVRPQVQPATLAVVVQIVDRVRLTCPVVPCLARMGDVLELSAEAVGLGAALTVPLTWTVDHPELASVDAGKVTAIAAGVIVVKASSGKVFGEISLELRPLVNAIHVFCPEPFVVATGHRGTVAAPPLTGCLLAKRGSMTLGVEVIAGGKVTTLEPVEWTVSDPRVVTISSVGEIVGLDLGLTLVRVSVSGVVAEMPIEVRSSLGKSGVPVCSQLPDAYSHALAFSYSSKNTDGAAAGGTVDYQCQQPTAQSCLAAAVNSAGDLITDGVLAAAAGRCCCRR